MSRSANGAYVNTPGIYTDRHQQRWAAIAEAVHAEGGRMFVQLWHVGRMGHPDISGVDTVGPSPVAANMVAHTPEGKKPLPVPRPLEVVRNRGDRRRFPRCRPSRRRRRHGRRRDPFGQRLSAARVPLRCHQPAHRLLRRFAAEPCAVRPPRSSKRSPRRSAPERVGLRISPGNRRRRHARGRRDQRLRVAAVPHHAAGHRLSARADRAAQRRRSPRCAPLWAGSLVLNTPRDAGTDFSSWRTWPSGA